MGNEEKTGNVEMEAQKAIWKVAVSLGSDGIVRHFRSKWATLSLSHTHTKCSLSLKRSITVED